MKNAIDTALQKTQEGKKKALIAYVTGGYPSFDQMNKILDSLKKGGVDIVEIGVPFSDPIADGPTIQLSSQEALKKKTSLQKILEWLKSYNEKCSLPIIIMSYLNPIWKYGLPRFAKEAQRSGVSGVIIPDLIPEESLEMEQLFRRHKIHLIYLLAPTTPSHRQRAIAKRSGGFLYAVSVTGVTGARKDYAPETKLWLKRLSHLTKRPICVGFGISGPRQIRQLKPYVNGFIVGSALIEQIRKNPRGLIGKRVHKFISSLAKECNHAS